MAEVIWVEVVSRHREVIARHRCEGPEIRIGRGYGNDIVLDDPRVAAEHLRIFRGAGGDLIAEDAGSAGGLFADRGTERRPRIILDGDSPIRIGDTWLRVRDASHVVAPERLAAPRRRGWALVAVLGTVALAAAVLSVWLRDAGEPKLSRYVTPIIVLSLVALGWTAGWATLSRIFSGAARFERNLLIALAGLLAYRGVTELLEFLAFAMSWPLLGVYQYAAGWCVLGLVCFLHLRAASPGRLRAKGAAVAALAVAAFAVQSLWQFEGSANLDQQRYVGRLLPPGIRLAPLATEAAFFTEVERLRLKLDQDRMRDPGSGWGWPLSLIDGGE